MIRCGNCRVEIPGPNFIGNWKEHRKTCTPIGALLRDVRARAREDNPMPEEVKERLRVRAEELKQAGVRKVRRKA